MALLLALLTAVSLGALSVMSMPAASLAAADRVSLAPAACAALSSPGQIPAPTVITFDDLAAGTSIGSFYQRTHGVSFEEGRTRRVMAYDHPLARSAPMTAMSDTSEDPAAVPLNFTFDAPQANVGMFLGNGGGATTARLQGFDADGNLVCETAIANVPDGHTAFIGFRDDAVSIVSVALTYVSAQAESLDDLHFSAVIPATATPTPTATRSATASPTGTPTRTATSTATRTATFTPTRTATPTATRATPTPTRTATRPAAALFISPAQAAPGGQPRVGGYGFPALADLRLILVCPSRAELDLGAARADATGRLQATITAPAYPPNPCLLAARQGATTLADTPLTVLPALELAFSPQGGPPGAAVNFTVRNLVAGDLRLDYAGRVVVGPLAVPAGSYSGSFIVPNDRPDPLGAVAAVRASNLVVGRVVGAATGSYRSEAGPAPAAYRVADLQLPGSDLPPGSQFTITGRISPAPQGSLAGFQVVPVWRKADGRTLPIGREAARIAADGSFDVRVRVPSLLTGDPTWPEAGDQVGVLLLAPANGPQPFLQAIAGPPLFPKFVVKVVDAQTQQLIPTAKVSLEVWEDQVSAGSLGQLAGEAATGISNQVGQVLGTTELTDDEKAMIALTKAMCIPIGIPVNQNKWELINPTLDQALSEPSVQGLLQGNSVIVEAVGQAGQSAQADFATVAAISNRQETAAGNVIPYLLTVDALDAGYGLKDADGAVKNVSLHVNFHLADLTYRDLKGNILPNPYTVALGKLSSGDQSALGPIGVFVAGIGAPELPSPTSLPRFDRYYSAKNAPAGVQVKKNAEGAVYVSLTYAQFHKLGAGGMKLYLDGVWVANFSIQFNPGLICDKFKGTQQKSAPFYEGKAVIPNAHLLASGARSLQVRAQLSSGQWASYSYLLQVDPIPASWFTVSAGGTRTLNWRPGEAELFTPWLKPAANTEELVSGPETNETGPLSNRTIPSNNFSQRAEANGHKGAQTSGQLVGQALNRDGQGCNLSYCPPTAAAVETLHATSLPTSLQQPAADPVASHTYGPHKEVVVPTITFDLPEVKYGIPFVAEVAGGGSFSYGASVTYGGATTILDDGTVQSSLTIDPEADVSGTVYVEGRLLSGLIGKAGASLTANFDLHMPVTYDTAKNEPLTKAAYFEYGADFKAWHKWGCVPYVGCAYSKEYPKPLFHDCKTLQGTGGCPPTANAQAVGRAATVAAADEPPQFDLQLASNGQGALMAIWSASLTSLQTSVFDGAAWSAAQTIPTGLGSAQPQVAFLAPNRAIAVWIETNLTAAQLPGLSGEELLRAQRIAYALWDGVGWSAGQPLTMPSLGEGGPALAACLEWQSGCPAGGAAAAVWERNLSADLNARQIRLYYAIYQNGVWTAPQPVDVMSQTEMQISQTGMEASAGLSGQPAQPAKASSPEESNSASAFTDILPQAAYVNGVPLVAWVRDSDADLTDASSRRIALRFLDGGATFTPAELPAAIGEVALAVDGNGSPILAFTQLEDPHQLLSNQRPLWIAAVTCSGPATCAWQPRKVTDAAGRTLYAERPLLTVDADDQPAITFRGLGFGAGLPVQAGDPPGMRYNLGELAQVAVNPATGLAAPAYLTQDGAVNWLPAAAYDPLLGVTVALAVQGVAPAGLVNVAQVGNLRYSPAPDLPIVAAAVPNLPDFVLADATLTGGPATGDPLRAVVRVANAGATWPGSAEQPLVISAAWDGAPGIGSPAGQITLTSLGPAPFVTVTLDLAPPPAGLDAPHELHVAINSGLAIAEADGADNSQIVTVGGILPPVGLWAQVEPGSGLVFLGWEAVADRRVAGYRVYRAESGGAWQPLGGSFAPGYVDLTASVGRAYRYAVTAYTAEGGESPFSPQFNVGARPLRIYLPLVGRGAGRQ
jgi:hypothetical protein